MPHNRSKTVVLGFVSLAALVGVSACSSGGGGLNFGGGAGVGADTGAGAGSGSGSGSADAGGGGGGAGAGSGSGSGGGSGSGSGGGAIGTASDGTLQRVVDQTDPLVTAGNAVLPGAQGALDDAAADGDEILNPVAAVAVADDQVVGSSADDSEQLVAISAASEDGEASAEGELATLNLAEDGNILSLDLNGDGLINETDDALADAQSALSGQDALAASLSDTTLGGDSAAIGLSALSDTQKTGTIATLGADSAGQTLTAGVAGNSLTDGATGQAAGALPGGGLNAIVNNSTGNVVGASVLAPTQTTGSLATAGVGTGGETALVNVDGDSLTGGVTSQNLLNLGGQ